MPLSPSTSSSRTRRPTRSTTSYTSDRNFYDRYYFNMHSSSDELFVIIGLGQYPNLGVTDAFITVSIGTEQHTVRASRELGSDRMDTTVGPLGGRGHRGPAQAAPPLRRRTSGASPPTSRSPASSRRWRSRARSAAATAACIQDVTRYAQVGVLGGHAHRRRPHVRRHARPVEGRARPLVGRPPRRRARGARASRPTASRTATASATTGCRCSSTTTCSRSRSTRTPTATATSRSRCGSGTSTSDKRDRAPRHARGRHRLPLRHA